ncbi:DNA-3-methyladenine glycosylase 2 family protein [Sporosarcina sp.]|uniref:DNA-3-methyladenine glycosylase family protein n=1 Tax=Sporosarcina sp. TaxID=49982 RepID=UPI002622AFCC|nr:DNA-3-methyladenine glycosylase 2 family protein [Sporosarcina sp.]
MNKLTLSRQDEGVQYICDRDPVMKKLIVAAGDIEISLRTDHLASVVRSIVGQQISVSAASAIYNRLQKLLGGQITVEGLLTNTDDHLKQVGLTQRKVQYVKDLAEKVAVKELDLESIDRYSNESVMEQLINVKGIGKWTAEMFLLLSLGRQDVLAVNDVGIQRAAQWLYGVEKLERQGILVEKLPLWKPHRSIVSFYLWEAIHLGFVTDYHTIDNITVVE